MKFVGKEIDGVFYADFKTDEKSVMEVAKLLVGFVNGSVKLLYAPYEEVADKVDGLDVMYITWDERGYYDMAWIYYDESKNRSYLGDYNEAVSDLVSCITMTEGQGEYAVGFLY